MIILGHHTPVPETLFNKVAGLRPATLLKKRLAQVFFYEFYKISKNTYSYRTPLVAASQTRTFIYGTILQKGYAKTMWT